MHVRIWVCNYVMEVCVRLCMRICNVSNVHMCLYLDICMPVHHMFLSACTGFGALQG